MRKITLLITLAITLFLSSCDKNSTPNPKTFEVYDYTDVLNAYVDLTIIPTYLAMKDNSKDLLSKVTSFVNSNSQSDLEVSCNAWKNTRKPWEQSEAFLFGPAAYSNLDPLLDSWPLDQAQLQQVLDSDAELTVDYVKEGLGAVLRGFHTIEFLLFREGEPRNAADFTQREKQYLVAVCEVLRDDCLTLWALWDGGSSETELMQAIELEVAVPYGEEFKLAGKAGSRYVSQIDAVDEILQGIIVIADEVGSGKIGTPVESGNVLEVESWFSWNSREDFKDNMRSIENAYCGGIDAENRGSSLSDILKIDNPDLDSEVKEKINKAIDAIDAIPQPFRNNLNHENCNLAIDAVNELLEIFETKVRPAFIN